MPPQVNILRLLGNVVLNNGSMTLSAQSLSGFSANGITDGTLNNARLPPNISVSSVSGNGSGLTGLDASNITTGTLAIDRIGAIDANVISVGTLDFQRLPWQVIGLFGENNDQTGILDNNVLPQDVIVSNVTASGYFFGNGSFVTDLDASELKTGTLDLQRLPDNVEVRGTLDVHGNIVSNTVITANVITARELTVNGARPLLIGGGSNESNVTIENTDVTIDGNLTVTEFLTVGGARPLLIGGGSGGSEQTDVVIESNVTIDGNLIVAGETSFLGDVVSNVTILGNLIAPNYIVDPSQFLGDLTDVSIDFVGNLLVSPEQIIGNLSNIEMIFVGGLNAEALTEGRLDSARLPLEPQITGNLTPSANVLYDLGSSTHRWKDLYLAGNTLYLGNTFIREGLNESVQLGGSTTTVTAESFTGNGALLTSLDASQLTTGAVPADRFGTQVGIGEGAGANVQSVNAVAIGLNAGSNTQGSSAVAVGVDAGRTSQRYAAVAVGSSAGQTGQGSNAVAVGFAAGSNIQGDAAVAVGFLAGLMGQGVFSTAVGAEAGWSGQGGYAVAIGREAGWVAQGCNAVAIGPFAGVSNQANNSIVINATSMTLDNTVANSTVIKPVRDVASVSRRVALYDSTSGEVSTNSANFVLDASNRVGIGTNTPTANLDVTGTGRFTQTLSLGNTLGIFNPTVAMTIEFSPNITGSYDGIRNVVYTGSEVLSAKRIIRGIRTTASSELTDAQRGTQAHDIRGIQASAYGGNYSDNGAATVMYGGYFEAIQMASTSTTTISLMTGVLGDVRNNGTAACTTAIGVDSVVIRAGGIITNGYLYRGQYLTADPDISTRYGIHLSNEQMNYFSGNVGIGTTNPQYQLQLSTNSAAKPSTNTWTVASDRRLKANVEIADEARCIDIIKSLPLQRFEWTPSYIEATQERDHGMLGWIAQDVANVFPKAVTVTKEYGLDDCHALDVDQLYKVTYGALRRALARIDDLEARLAALESR